MSRRAHFRSGKCCIWSKHRRLLLLSLLCATLVIVAHGLPPPSTPSIESNNVPIQIQLLNPDASNLLCSSLLNLTNNKDCPSDLYYIRLSGFDVTPMFPFTRETTLQLYRDPALNRQQRKNTEYNVFVIDQDGVDQRVDGLDMQDNRIPADSTISFFRGHVISSDDNIPNSKILAIGYVDSKGGLISLQAFIQHHNSLFYLRPGSDARNANLHFISNENGSMGKNFFELFQRQFAQQQSRLYKRQSDKVNQSCSMMIHVDYSLFQLMNESRAKTVLFVHFVFTLGNDIFLNTKFTKSGFPNAIFGGVEEEEDYFEGYGHTLCTIVIEEHEARYPTDFLYNEEKDFWRQSHLEEKMSNLKDRGSYCLAYLFTNLRIEGARYGDVNGFAMEGGIFSDKRDVPNTGVVSFAKCKDPWNLYCVLNFPHELAHSWGSRHDADTEDCLPSTNGSYLVSFPFLDQLGENNFKLSPCSIRAIYIKIEDLLSSSIQFTSYCAKCGNGILEEPEECDEGSIVEGTRKTGDCCTRSCKFKLNATCSPFNHECCDDECQVKQTNDVCRSSDPQYCFSESRCDGRSFNCPDSIELPDGSPCHNGGFCQAGFCNSTCPAGYANCQCHDACRICCQQLLLSGNVTTRSECQATNIFMPDGSACLYNETSPGQCTEGWCKVIKGGDDLPDGPISEPPSSDLPGSQSWFADQYIFFLVLGAIATIFIVVIYCFRCGWNRSNSARFEIVQYGTQAEIQPLRNGQECLPRLTEVIKKSVANGNH